MEMEEEENKADAANEKEVGRGDRYLFPLAGFLRKSPLDWPPHERLYCGLMDALYFVCIFSLKVF